MHGMAIGRLVTDMYELSKYVYATLVAAANSDSVTFTLLEPRADETGVRYAAMMAEVVEINDLINMELLRDVSDRFTEQIEICKINHGFGYKVVTMTDAAVLMFKHRKGFKELPC